MTGERPYAHDVAFSFMQQDEPLALRFRAALEPLSSFVYSKMQEQLAGTDGMESFRAAFRTDSRLNVVLLRAGWGTTRWTRVEENAIKDRCFEEGFDSLLVVKVEKSPNLKWCPDRRIYFNIEAFPFEQAVGAIKRQADQLGSNVRPLTALEKVQHEAEGAEYDRETRELLGSERGVREADAAVQEIFGALERDLAELGLTVPRWEPKFGRGLASGATLHAVAWLGQCSVGITWQRYANSLRDSKFEVTVFDRHVPMPQDANSVKLYGYAGRPVHLVAFSLKVDRRPGLGLCWRISAGAWASSTEVAGKILEALTKAARGSERN